MILYPKVTANLLNTIVLKNQFIYFVINRLSKKFTGNISLIFNIFFNLLQNTTLFNLWFVTGLY
ncbi:MAG TPA: hypothetical protein DCQ15_03830 [Chitinophagaceae bacterium]|nr:hypothetical protein [Chitinophagaceae bacterium]